MMADAVSELPADSRERTILTTDIVGSTALLRRYPNDMLNAMDQHDRILHAAIRRHAGDPFRSTGDGVLAIFDRPLNAVMAAVEAQRGMREAAWGPTGRLQVRFGIHTGLTRQRGEHDYFGPALPTATRLQSAANADQILLSGTTVQRLASDLIKTPFQLSDLGEHHFKGIDPIRVHQVSAADLPNTFPPIGGKRETASGNLPANLSSFLGRERELEELLQIALQARLITLVGPGGIGKTRLAIEFARLLENSFSDGAWLVDLSALERDSEVWPAIAEALLIPPLPGVEPRVQLLERLHNARAILLMDNCEHVLDPIANAVTELGSACGELFLINTSRGTLGIEGEAIYEVRSLYSRSQGSRAAGGHSDGRPTESAATRLFIERGRLANRRFNPSRDELCFIERICESIDCMPLAIEIAAAQLRQHSLARIESGISKPLDLHSSSFRRRTGRHRTLRQAIEWSYDLLDENCRRVLQRLSILSGCCHAEQALAICAADMPSEDEVLRGINELVEASLLNRDARQRLRMLQTLQAFGREKLDQTGLLQTVETRHGEVYAARARQLGEQIASIHEAKAASAIYDEMPNLRAAFDRAVTRELKLAADLAAPLFLFNYWHRGAETGGWYERIMARPGADRLEQAPLLLAAAAGHSFHAGGDSAKAAAFIERGFRAEAAGMQSSQGWLSHVSGQMAQWFGDLKGCLTSLTAAVQEARGAGNVPCKVMSLCMIAYIKARVGDRDGARDLIRDINEAGKAQLPPTVMGYIHYARGGVAEDPKVAIDEYQTTAEYARMAGNPLGAQRVRQLIADLLSAKATPAEALDIHVQSLIELPSHGATFYTWLTIRSLIMPLAGLKAYEVLAVLAGALRRSPLKLDRSARNAVETARQKLGQPAFELAAERGSRFDPAEARRYIIDVWRGMDANRAESGSAGF
jgi:predicted ATPase/class 3 adenylate cyclase